MVYIGIQKEIFIFNRESCLGEFNGNILIIEPHFLHFRRRGSITAVNDSVSAEIIVSRAFSVVTAVSLKPFPVAILFVDGLVDIIPDKPTLITWFPVRQFSVFVHRPAGISHGMGIFTQNKGFFRMVF